MNPGIYYLYEYKNNHRMRNTGFLKLTQKPAFWLLQIQSRNISVTKQHSLPLYAILSEHEHILSQKLGELPCNHHAISAQLTIPNSDIASTSSTQNLRGFLIQLPDKTWLAATEAHFHLNIDEILTITTQIPPKIDSETEPHIQEDESDTAVNPTPDTPEPSSVPDSEPSELSASEYTDNNEQLAPFEMTEPPFSSKTIRKIHRSDLKILPRKCWNLANNSFLLHGYHNYHHLLLIEENGHYQLGVPGVYDIREARAAEIFGFPEFIDSYNDQMELSAAECNTQEKFGYWCHYIY